MRVHVLLFCFAVCCGLPAGSQTPVAPPLHSHKPIVEQGVEGGLWHLEKNFESRLIITNVLRDTPMKVTPFLYMADGTEYQLDDVTLSPGAIGSVDINRSLASAPAAIQAHASSNGMAGIRYQWRGPGSVMASIQSTDEMNRVTYVTHLQSGRVKVHNLIEKPGPQTIEGMWWQQYSGVGGFISVSNAALQPVTATLDILDSTGAPFLTKTLQLGTHQTTMLDLGQLLGGSASPQGGIRVSWVGVPWAITAQGGMQDDTTGYSAALPLTEFPDYGAAEESTGSAAYDSPGIMIGAQAPSMNFPVSTRFSPYEAMRNLTDRVLHVQIAAVWMDKSGPKTASVGSIALQPYTARQLELPELLKSAGVPADGEVNLRTSFDGKYSDLMISTGSIDQSRDFVFEVSPSIEHTSNSRILCYWQTFGETSTMISLWNYSPTAENLVVTFQWDGGSYDYPVTLAPSQSTTLDVAQIIHQQLADGQGRVIPQYIHEGRATLSRNGDPMALFDAAGSVSTYNVRNATCGVQCYSCNGVADAWLESVVFGLNVQQTATATAWITLQDGGGTYQWGSVNLNSSNPSVATASGALITAVSAGSAYVNNGIATGYPGAGDYCYGTPSPVNCPPSVSFTQSTVNSQAIPQVIFDSFSSVQVGSTATVGVSFTNGATSSPVPITLQITTIPGTGRGLAVFANSSTNMNISAPTSVIITGLTASDTQANMYLDASVPNINGSGGTQSDAINPQSFTVIPAPAFPNNLQLTNAVDEGNGFLHMTFTWGSTSGNLTDLSACQVRENVTYPTIGNSSCPANAGGPVCFWPPSPPWPPTNQPGTAYVNPTLGAGPAVAGQVNDSNTVTNLNFVQPYSQNSFQAAQNFEYSCSGGPWTNFGGPFTITRQVTQQSSQWVFEISKTGIAFSSILVLP